MAPKPATVKDTAVSKILNKKPVPSSKQPALAMNRGSDIAPPLGYLAAANNPKTATKAARPTRTKKGY